MRPASVISMLRLALACLVLGLIVAVPAANAASTTQILRDCADDGVLQGDYKPAELRKAAGEGAPAPIRLNGRSVLPGTAGLSSDAVRNELPTPLIIVLALPGAAALATLSPFVRRHVIARFKR